MYDDQSQHVYDDESQHVYDDESEHVYDFQSQHHQCRQSQVHITMHAHQVHMLSISLSMHTPIPSPLHSYTICPIYKNLPQSVLGARGGKFCMCAKANESARAARALLMTSKMCGCG